MFCNVRQDDQCKKAAINQTFSSCGGVLWQGIKDNQLCTFLMKATEEFWANDTQNKTKKAALVIGKQEQLNDTGMATYILNDKTQV